MTSAKETMEKLPVLFVSCSVDRLGRSEHAVSGPARMVWGRSYEAVVMVGIGEAGGKSASVRVTGHEKTSSLITQRLTLAGFEVERLHDSDQEFQALETALFGAESGEQVGLTIAAGLEEQAYQAIGQCLQRLREEGVLLIFLDDNDDISQEALSAKDHHLRDIIDGWVRSQQWESVLSFRSGGQAKDRSVPINDPTVCLLKAAFSLGGARFPQRMFSSGMNTACAAMSGYGWMR